MHELDLAAITRVKAGDREAFAELVERHSRGLFRLGYRITGNESDAEEVVQESFLRAYREIGRYESRASFSTWIHTIATNYALDLVRKGRRSVAADPEGPEPASPTPGPEREASSRVMGERIESALAELSLQERTAFVLRHYEGIPLESIGVTLGLTENAVKQSIFRAVRKLRRSLAPWISLVCLTFPTIF